MTVQEKENIIERAKNHAESHHKVYLKDIFHNVCHSGYSGHDIEHVGDEICKNKKYFSGKNETGYFIQIDKSYNPEKEKLIEDKLKIDYANALRIYKSYSTTRAIAWISFFAALLLVLLKLEEAIKIWPYHK